MQHLMLEFVVSPGNGGVFDKATSVCAPPDETERLFITTADGIIHIVSNGAVLPTPFLDISDKTLYGTTDPSFGEGLQSIAFHPNYATNRKFYVLYLEGAGAQGPFASHLVEYKRSVANPNTADANSATQILGPVQQPGHVHNWDCLKFGLDGMLYISTGDGGGDHGISSDSGRGQNLASTLGKILRINVDIPSPYIPTDNPFVGQPRVAEEIWAYGLRQPWRFAFDSDTGDMFIGDVGQTTREELDFIPGGSSGGQNFGWACKEGTFPVQAGLNSANCAQHTARFPLTDIAGCLCPNETSYIEPILDYPHGATGGCSIIGGEVYRGLILPVDPGTYFYGDYCTAEVFSLRYDGENITNFEVVSTQQFPLETVDGDTMPSINSFGIDASGEIYIVAGWAGGPGLNDTVIYRIIPK